MKNEGKIKSEKNDTKEVMIQENSEDKNKQNEDITTYFKKTMQNTLSTFFLSLILTIVNFTCNIPLLRKVSKDSYAVVKVYFELAFTLVNYVPRETMRRASQKFCPDKDPEKENEKFIILSQINYIFLLFNAFISIFVFFSFIIFTDSEKLHQNYIQLIIYILCGLIEMIIEPIVLYMNLNMENKFLPITISSLSRVVSNTVFIAFFNMDLWSFTLSRIFGSSVYILFILFTGIFKYNLNFSKFIPFNIKSLIFDKSSNNGINLSYLREIFYEFIKLNLLNLILSKSQNLVLSFFIKISDEEKSDYSFISQNYSLISRFLLPPITDAFYNLVNKIKHIEKKRREYFKQENDINKIKETQEFSDNTKMTELVEKRLEKPENDEKKESKETKKEINYDLSIKLLQFFIKIIVFIGILIIPYYILIGTEVMGLIYGKKWQTNAIDKIGDCYSYFVIFTGISDLINNLGNATNDKHQMNLSYIALISNAIIASISMFLFSKWDICGLIISNILSLVYLINFNLYIIFCGKIEILKYKNAGDSSIYEDISYFINKCFLSKYSLIATLISIFIAKIIKNLIISHVSNIILILMVSLIGLINVFFIYKFDYNNLMKDLNIIKSYQ